MFLHLGGDFSICLSDVVSIHDAAAMRASEEGRRFLSGMKKRTVDVSGGRPRSVVVTETRLYLSALSSETLGKRSRAFHRNRFSAAGPLFGREV